MTKRLFLLLLSAMSPLHASSDGPVARALQPFLDEHALVGAVTAVATKDRVLDLETVGYADLGRHVPMQPDTLFWIASMTKPMTAVAAMMLVEEGKIGLDDPVSKYIPAFADLKVQGPNGPQPPQRPVLVRDLLSHSSGLPFKSPVETPTLDLLSLERRAGEYAKLTLQSEPGAKYSYSNAGLNTIGRIIEIVSGRSYEQFMEERIFRPLGMNDTTFIPTEAQLARLARSYTANPDKTDLVESKVSQLHYPLNDPARTPMPAGGLFSTAADVLKFCQMLANGGATPDGRRLISPESLRLATSKQTAPDETSRYGFGFSLGTDSFGHGGAYKTNMKIFPATGLIVVFLVQQNGDWIKDGKRAPEVFESVARKMALPAP